jgi:hypothetical protein
MGSKLLCTSGRKVNRTKKQMFQAYEIGSGISLEYGQAMVAAWRRYEIISRT